MSDLHPFAQRLADAGLLTPKATGEFTRTTWKGTTAVAGDERAARYAEVALDGECNNIAQAAEGTRNDTLNRAAYKIGGFVASGHLNGQHVIDRLTEAAQAAGLDPTEIARTVPRATHDGAGSPRTVHLTDNAPAAFTIDPIIGPTGGTVPDPTVVQTQTATQWALENLPRLNWAAIWDDSPEQEWIVEPILAVGRLVALYSPPKAGKSLLTLEIAAAIAAGRSVLGQDAGRPRVVLYVDFENDPRGDTVDRLRSMGYTPDDLDNLVVLSFPTLSALDSDRGGLELMAAVEAYAAEVVIIDTVSRSVAGEENSNDTWLSFYRHTGLRLKAAGVAALRLDHTGKDETKGQRGGSAKVGDVDAIWRLGIADGEIVTLTLDASRFTIDTKELVMFRVNVPHLHHKVDTSGHARIFDNKVAEIVAALDALKVPADASVKASGVALRSSGLKAKNNELAAAVKRRKLTVSPWDDAHGGGP